MITAAELLDAVKKGGIENWATTTGRDAAKEHNTRRWQQTQDNIDSCFAVLDKPMTAQEVSHAAGFKYGITCRYLNKLVDDGLVCKSIRGQPKKFWKK